MITPITTRKIVQSLESLQPIRTQEQAEGMSASASFQASNASHASPNAAARRRPVTVYRPTMSFAYGAASGSNEESPRRVTSGGKRTATGRRASAAPTSRGNSEQAPEQDHDQSDSHLSDNAPTQSSSRRTANAYPGAWNGNTSSPRIAPTSEAAAARHIRRLESTDSRSGSPPYDQDEDNKVEAEVDEVAEEEEDEPPLPLRGNDTGIIQQSEKPTEASSKDTSVNIATAFRQAATVTGNASDGSQAMHQGIENKSSAGVGFLKRAGDKEVALNSAPDTDGPEIPTESYHSNSYLQGQVGTQQNQAMLDTSFKPQASSNATKKRKQASSSGQTRITATKKDPAFIISKEQLNAVSSDEFESNDESVDLEELKSALENGMKGIVRKNGTERGKRARKYEESHSVSRTGSNPSKKGRRRLGNEDETSHLDGNLGVEGSGEGTVSLRGRTAIGEEKSRTLREASLPTDIDREVSQAPSVDGTSQSQYSNNMTSFYLRAPSEQPESVQGEPQLSLLTQIHPKTTTYQPYFAFSTTLDGRVPADDEANSDGPRMFPVRRRRESSIPISQISSSARDTNGLLKTSSNASFEQRDSNYDYAEEERMLAQLQAAKERGENGRKIPEGRTIRTTSQILKGMTGGTRVREISLSLSEQSHASHLQGGPQNQEQSGQALRKPVVRRAPPPPQKSQSVISASSNDHSFTAPDISKKPKISTGRRIGEIVRQLLVLLYWIIVRPVQMLRTLDVASLLKWAAAIALLGLIIGRMGI